MIEVATLSQARSHLRLDGTTEHDTIIQMKLDEATALCVDYIYSYIGDEDERAARAAVIDAWTLADDPIEFLQLRAGVLKMTGHLFRFRGDDDKNAVATYAHGVLPPDVTMYLNRLRDPVLS
jgi:hypothetical protein